MDKLFEIKDQDVLVGLVGAHRRRRRAAKPSAAATGVRFAFYGRTSTAEFQDRRPRGRGCARSPQHWSRGHGTITLEFFDVGCSRRVAWERHPQAAALLERACASDRAFDAAVVGEFERAFTDRQIQQVAGLFATARWSGDALGLALADLIMARLLPADSAITIAVDDTLAAHRLDRGVGRTGLIPAIQPGQSRADSLLLRAQADNGRTDSPRQTSRGR